MSGTAPRKSTTGRASAKPTEKGVSARTPASRPPARRTTRAAQAKARAVRRRRIRVAATLGILLALGLAVLARGTWEVRTTRLNETHFVTDELTAELRVVQVTDFHNIPRTTQVRDIVELVRAAEPDLIAITGDLVNTHNRTLDPARRLLAGLAGIDAPRYFVDGNHDHWSTDHSEVHRLLEAHGVTIMGHVNVPSRLAQDATNLYAKNLLNLVTLLVDKETKALNVPWDDEIVKGALVARDGAIAHPQLQG